MRSKLRSVWPLLNGDGHPAGSCTQCALSSRLGYLLPRSTHRGDIVGNMEAMTHWAGAGHAPRGPTVRYCLLKDHACD